MLKSVSSNWALNALQILVFMALARFTLTALGQGTFGVWETIVAAAGPLQLLVLGVPMGTVRRMSEALGRGDADGANRALGQSVSLTLCMAATALAVGVGIWAGFQEALLQGEGWSLSPAEVLDGRSALAVYLANLAAGFCLRLPYTALEAHQDFITKNQVMGAGMLLRLGATVGALSWRPDLLTLAWVHVLVAAFEFVAALAVTRRRHPSVRFRAGRLVWTEVRALLGFSLFAFLMNMGALFAFQLDALVIGAHMAPEDVATYGMANKIFDPLVNLLLAIGMVVMPAAATLRVQGREGELVGLLHHWSKVAAFLVTTLGGYLLVFGPEFLAWWLGPEYDPAAGRLLQVLMASFLLFLPVRGVALPILLGAGNPRGPGLGLMAMGLGNLVLSLALVREHGLLGVALGTAIPNALFALAFVARTARALHTRAGAWLGHALGRVTIGWLPGLALLVAVKLGPGAEGFWPLVAVGLAYSATQLAVGVLFIWRGDAQLDPLARWRARGGAAA